MTAARSLIRALLVACFALPFALLLAGPAQAATYECTPMSSDACKQLQPVAECVWDNGDGTTTALWGWNNPTADSAHIPPSNKNNVWPGADDQGQPTLFGPGRIRNVFTTTFTGTRADRTRVEVHGCDLLTLRDGKIALKNSYRKNRPPLGSPTR